MKFLDIEMNINARVMLFTTVIGWLLTILLNELNIKPYNKYMMGFGLAFMLLGLIGLIDLYFQRAKRKAHKKKQKEKDMFDHFKYNEKTRRMEE